MGSSALVLCIALTGALFLPGTVQAPTVTGVPTETQSIYFNTTVFSVTGDILSTGVNGPETLQYIGTLQKEATRVNSYTDAQKTATEDVVQSQAITYRFEIIDHLGSRRCFTLAGGVLVDEDTKTVYVLNSNQRLRLLRMLQIIKE